MAGKTGTAQVDSYCPTATGCGAGYLTWPAYKQDTSVFASFAPADDPRFAVDAVFEQSGYGADVAAPAVEQEYQTLFGLNKPARKAAPLHAGRTATATTTTTYDHRSGPTADGVRDPAPPGHQRAGATVPRRPVVSPAWRHVDVALVAATAAISALGVLMVYSTTRTPLAVAGDNPQSTMKKQAIYAVVGVAAFLVTIFFDYRRYLSWAPGALRREPAPSHGHPGRGPEGAGRHLVDPGREHPGRAVRDSQGDPHPVAGRPAGPPQGRPSRAKCCCWCWPCPSCPSSSSTSRTPWAAPWCWRW